MHYSIVADLVRKTLRAKPLPENFHDLSERDQRPFLDRANAEGKRPEELYEVVRTRQAEDLKEAGSNDFDPRVIALAVRTGPFTGHAN